MISIKTPDHLKILRAFSIVWGIITVVVSRLILKLLWVEGRIASSPILQSAIEYEVEYYHDASNTEDSVQGIAQPENEENILMSEIVLK